MIRSAGPDVATTRPCTPHDRWRADRLTEARAILAGRTLHPDRLLILAARVVIAHSADDAEVADALATRRRSEGGRTAP